MSRSSMSAPTASLRAAAARIGVSLPTLYKLIESGKLRSYHVGRAHRVSDEAVRECVALLELESRASFNGESRAAHKEVAANKLQRARGARS